jgi:hypothetical protein
MYNDKGENYWIATEWGNEAFGHTGTRGMVKLTYNLLYRVLFMPEYDTERYPFPPPLELIMKLYKERLTMHESRMFELRHADLIFFASAKRAGRVIPAVYRYKDDTGVTVEEKKLICCIDPKIFARYSTQLRAFPKDRFNDIRPDFPYPFREDVMDTEVYRFIDDIIRQYAELLPKAFRESLQIAG